MSPTIPQSEGERLSEIIEALEKATEGNRRLDAMVEVAVTGWPAGSAFEYDSNGGYHVLGPNGGKGIGVAAHCYTTSLDAALRLVPDGWWWHVSHLEAVVIPTRPLDGPPVNNATMYEKSGRPVSFRSYCHHDRKRCALALATAAMKARFAISLPRPIPAAVRRQAQRLLKKANPQAQWTTLERAHQFHWIAAALRAKATGAAR